MIELRYMWLVVAGLAVILMTLGLARGEWGTVKRQAETFCTSCVGLNGHGG